MSSVSNSLHDTDNSYRKIYGNVIGVDEAGRGPLAGPVTAAAVMFEPEVHHELIRDSKKLSEKQRDTAYEWIVENAVKWAVKTMGVQAINRTNILHAALSAMGKAVQKIDEPDARILVDGNRIPEGLSGRADALTGGDRTSFSIAAASILAKVSRDRIMKRWSEIYPEYRFDKHKGYGTPEHIKAIGEYNPCPIHRRYFEPIKSMQLPERPGKKTVGRWGENWAVYYLILKGYRCIERNYHGGNKGEIDIIMQNVDQFVMVEVKTTFGFDIYRAVEHITEDKVEKMMQAAERYFYDLNMPEYRVRFDAITVSGKDWFAPRIEHLENIIG